jgi:uncharacterized protein with ATP-grasp and redox domains
MKPFNECIPCYFKQQLSVLQVAKIDKNKVPELLYEGMKIIPELSNEANPAYNSSQAILKMYELINNYNPYKDAKKVSNDFALSIYNDLKTIINESLDHLLAAFKVAVVGNIIDMGVSLDFDIDKALNEITTKEFDYNNYKEFKEQLDKSKNILILGDNAGEIAFDKLLVEELLKLKKNIIYCVKSFPTINDATLEDAMYVEMDKLVPIITTGSELVGATLSDCSSTFLEYYNNADIIIAKGQANYESLEHEPSSKNKVFFVLRAKCPCIANHIGVELGNIVFKQS